MKRILTKTQQPNSIRAMFEDGMSTFDLPSNATLGELAHRIAQLGDRHQGSAIAFEARLGPPC
jgi:hypothetical protein